MRARTDGFAAKHAAQLIRQRSSARQPMLWSFSKATKADRLQIASHHWIQQPRRDRLAFDHLPQSLDDPVRLERRIPVSRQ